MRLTRSIIFAAIVLVIAGTVGLMTNKNEDQLATSESVDVSKEHRDAATEKTFNVVVKFSGEKINEGQIIAGLFNSEEDFGVNGNALQRCVLSSNSKGETSCEFTNLAPGAYAISAFHDINGNSILDKNAIGIPQEKYGFSNNARGHFGPPEFLECEFEVSDASVVEIKLR